MKVLLDLDGGPDHQDACLQPDEEVMADTGQRPAGRPVRRRNVERSAATRTQILEATIRALHQFGYGAVTNQIVAGLAGVSRGAMMHHFPTRQDLLVAVTEYAYGKLAAYRLQKLERLKPGLPRFRAIIDLAFETAGSPEGLAVNEIRAGSRSDPDFARALTPMMTHISNEYGRFLGRHVRAAGLVPDNELKGLNAAVAMSARSLTIDRATHPRPEMIENMLLALKSAREHIIARQLGPDQALSLEAIARENAGYLRRRRAALRQEEEP